MVKDNSLQKPLTQKQALACEQANQPVCHCRCGGAYHGKKRGGVKQDGSIDLTFFQSLPEDDPHYLPSEEYKQRKRQEKLEAKRRAREEREKRLDEYLRNRPVYRDDSL